MSTPDLQQLVVQLLARLFPSFRGIAPEEALRRAESLGQFVARSWASGPEALSARGIQLPPSIHGPLAPLAPKVVEARRGGVEFLGHLRRGLGADAPFAQVMTGFAKAYAEAVRAGTSSDSAQLGSSSESGRLAPPASFSDALPDDDDGPALSPPPGRAAATLGKEAAIVVAPPSSGYGDLDLLPDDAPPPTAPVSRASPSTGPRIEPGQSGHGGLDLLPDDEPAPAPAAAAPQQRAPSGRQPAGGGGGGGGELDLLDEEPEAPAAAAGPSLEEMLYSAPAAGAAPPAASKGPAGYKSNLKRSGLKGTEKPPGSQDSDEDMLSAMEGPKDPAERALWRYERTGNPALLQEAEALFTEQRKKAPHILAAALLEAALAKIALLKGDAAQAKKRAEAALSRHPSNPLAVEVLVRAARGEAERAPYRLQWGQLAAILAAREFERARPLTQTLMQRYPQEPFPWLAMTLMERQGEDQAAFTRALSEAWKRYPSQEHPDLPMGGELDADLIDLLVHHGREPFKSNDEAGLRQTVENVDGKDNLIGGALRMAVAIGRVALAQQGLPRKLQRRLWLGMGSGLVGLQFYDAALPYFGKVGQLGPTKEEVAAVSKERLDAGALRRAFDRPGIKAQLKGYKCLGVDVLRATLQGRLERIRQDMKAREDELFALAEALVGQAREAPPIKAEVAAAAEAASKPSPFQDLDAIDAELEDVANQRRELQAGDPKGDKSGGGLFGKLKAAAGAAAAKVGDAARETRLKLKESQARARQPDAVKRLGLALVRDLEAEWKHPALVEFAKKAATLDAFLDFHRDEEKRGQGELERLSQTV